MKTCTKCGVEKPFSSFRKQAAGRDGYRASCKECCDKYQIKYNADNPARVREIKNGWASRNKESRAAYGKQHRADNVDWYKQYHQDYVAKNKAAVMAYRSQWQKDNKDKRCESAKKSAAKNPEKRNLRCAKRRSDKLNRTPCWAGGELDVLIKQEAFAKARQMTISTGIQHHVDHIVPLRGDVVSGLHIWNNLQILSASDNASKGNNFTSTEVYA